MTERQICHRECYNSMSWKKAASGHCLKNLNKLLQLQTVYRRLILHTGRPIVKHCHVLSSRNGTQQEFVCLER